MKKEDTDDLKAEFGDQIITEMNNSQDGIDEHLEVEKTLVVDDETVRNEPLQCSQWAETASGTLLIHRTAGLVPKNKVSNKET